MQEALHYRWTKPAGCKVRGVMNSPWRSRDWSICGTSSGLLSSFGISFSPTESLSVAPMLSTCSLSGVGDTSSSLFAWNSELCSAELEFMISLGTIESCVCGKALFLLPNPPFEMIPGPALVPQTRRPYYRPKTLEEVFVREEGVVEFLFLW